MKSVSQERLRLEEQVATLDSKGWKSIIEEMEEKLENFKECSDLECDTWEKWQERRRDMFTLRTMISLLDVKKYELKQLNEPDDEVDDGPTYF